MAKYVIFGVFPPFGSMIGHMSLIQFSIRNKIICAYQILISSNQSFVEVVGNVFEEIDTEFAQSSKKGKVDFESET